MRFITEFREGDMISSIYLCKDKRTLQTKAGKNYYSMQLHDKSAGRGVWSNGLYAMFEEEFEWDVRWDGNVDSYGEGASFIKAFTDGIYRGWEFYQRFQNSFCGENDASQFCWWIIRA